jgi:Family of unknown function (DUF6544)
MPIVAVAVLVFVLVGLALWRTADRARDARAWRVLVDHAAEGAAVFDATLVAGLPEPARRYFTFCIAPGARLRTVAKIDMRGELGLGTKERPDYAPMRATQILAPPYGLVWKVRTGRGAIRMDGSDGIEGHASWSRFWLYGLIPIVRAGGNSDHRRAAFGRVVAEAAFWVPAALLPRNGVAWEAVGADIARATVTHDGLIQTVDVTVAADGAPVRVVIPRWTDANPDKVFRLQPFGGQLSDFREFDGFRLPTRVEGGNFIGSDDYFPFYRAEVGSVRFPLEAR